MQKKVFKVLCPIERANGTGVWWMKCGSAYGNKDDSINIYIEAIPIAGLTKEGLKVQLRELTDEELRERAEKKASYSSRASVDPNGLAPLGDGYRGGFAPRGAHGSAQPNTAADEPVF